MEQTNKVDSVCTMMEKKDAFNLTQAVALDMLIQILTFSHIFESILSVFNILYNKI